jgi:type II secretory pathway pseudopilin PulG
MIVIAIIAILTTILLPNFVRTRSQGRLTGCKSNLKNLASAIESYSTDNGGRYPTVLSKLAPNHIQSIPSCPSAGSNTPYSTGFTSASNPDAYTLVCSGNFHAELNLPNGYPQYYSATGLVDR